MGSYKYPNLTIIDEMEIQKIGPSELDHAVVAKFPEIARDQIFPQNIHDAIEEQFDCNLSVADIAYYGPDFLILPPESTMSTLMLATTILSVSTFTLSLIPWSTEYGSTIVLLHTQLGRTQTIDFEVLAWHKNNPSCAPPKNQNLEIKIFGLPPHLCSDSVIHRLLDDICTIQSISFSCSTLTHTLIAYAAEPFSIPSIAHIGVKKTTQNSALLNIWPLWYDTVPLDVLGSPISEEKPTVSPTRRGSSAMHTEDHQEYIERLFDDGDDEATSRCQAEILRAYADLGSSDWEPYTP